MITLVLDPSRVDFVLVRPARGSNVAAACRAVKNMGGGRVMLVGAKQDLVSYDERAIAYNAWDVLDAAVSCASLAEALEGATFVAATSGRSDPPNWTPRQLAGQLPERAGGGRAAIVFGPESSGLPNAELQLCHATVTIPTSLEQPSLNLAQAVLLIAYELRIAAIGTPVPADDRAPVGEVEQAISELRTGMLEIGYLDPHNPEHILAELRRLVFRAAPTGREVTLLRGLARQMGWAGRRAAREDPG